MKWDEATKMELLGKVFSEDQTAEELAQFHALLATDRTFFRMYLDCIDGNEFVRRATQIKNTPAKLKTVSLSVAAAVLAFVGVGLWFAATSSNSQATTRIVRTMGQCELKGENVRTGSLSVCDIEFRDGSMARIYPQTEVSLVNTDAGSTYLLAKGQIVFQTPKRPKTHSIEIKTANVRVLLLGTALSIETGPDGTKLEVLEGVVQTSGTCAGIISSGNGTEINVHGCRAFAQDLRRRVAWEALAELWKKADRDPSSDSRSFVADMVGLGSQTVCDVVMKDGNAYRGILLEEGGQLRILERDGTVLNESSAEVDYILPRSDF